MKYFFPFFVFLFVFSANIYSHPAHNIITIFFDEKSELKFVVKHGVRESDKHFIDNIKVRVNNSLILDVKFFSQTDNNEQVLSYKINGLKNGDTIDVFANCNKGGTYTSTYIIGQGALL